MEQKKIEEIRERAINFCNELGLPYTRFAKNINLCGQSIRQWLLGNLKLKDSNVQKIDDFLKSFNR